MKNRIIVEYDYPVEHKPPVKVDIYLHGDKVTTGNIKPLQEELEEIKTEIDNIGNVEVTDGDIYVNEVNVFEILDKHINKAD